MTEEIPQTESSDKKNQSTHIDKSLKRRAEILSGAVKRKRVEHHAAVSLRKLSLSDDEIDEFSKRIGVIAGIVSTDKMHQILDEIIKGRKSEEK